MAIELKEQTFQKWHLTVVGLSCQPIKSRPDTKWWEVRPQALFQLWQNCLCGETGFGFWLALRGPSPWAEAGTLLVSDKGSWTQKGTGIQRVHYSWTRHKRVRSKLMSFIGAEPEEWGDQLVEKGGGKRKDTVCWTLVPGLSMSLVERQWTNMAQDSDQGACCIKSGTGQIWDLTKIMKKIDTKRGKNLWEFLPRISFEEIIPHSPPLIT